MLQRSKQRSVGSQRWHGGAVDGLGRGLTPSRPRLLGLAYRILSSYGDAEDVVQEAWIRWQGVDHDRTTTESPAAYLHRRS